MTGASESIALARDARKKKESVSDARALLCCGEDLSRPARYAHTIRHIADLYLDESKLADATRLYEEALKIYRMGPHIKLIELASTVRPYALLREGLGNVELARQPWLEAMSLYRSLRIEAGVEECKRRLERLQE